MSERLPKHLYDALQAARLASEFLGETPFDEYAANLLLRSAVERQLEILGEACWRILQEAPHLKTQLPETAFAIGLRNRIIHGYDRVDPAIIHDTVKRDMPELMERLKAALDAYPPPG